MYQISLESCYLDIQEGATNAAAAAAVGQTGTLPLRQALMSHRIKKLKEYVARQQVLLKIENDEEKVSAEMVPFHLMPHLGPLEELFWEAADSGLCSGIVSLHNRFVYCFPLQSAIWSESLFKASLSDFFDILFFEKEEDQSPYNILFLNILTGKTNQTGNKQLGQALRHKSAAMCAVGSFGFYLAARFLYTKEDEVQSMFGGWLLSFSHMSV